MKGRGYETVGIEVTPESAILAKTEEGKIVEVIDALPYSVEAATTLLAKRDELRATNALADTYEVLAVKHDCDENAVPCLTDGPLGHGWECGVCGAFLQAG